MHFWIDKRSQTCGFGRARVAASLSGGGGVGLGFGHPPRRMGGTKSLVTPIHRLHQNDSTRMLHMQQSPNNNNCNNINSNNYHHQQNIVNANSNNNSNSNNNNINNNSNSNNGGNTRISRSNRNSSNNANVQFHEINNHPLPGVGGGGGGVGSGGGGGLVGRRQNSSNNVYNHNIQRSNIPSSSVNNQECHIPLALPHIYGGPSHAQELEQGSLGLGPISTRQSNGLSNLGNASGNINAIDARESQLLPAHLKCGMWASLVLASVFVAGAKFYFDHQGTGLEVLIFCAFSATFFLAACTVSICRLPRDLATSPSPSVDGHTRGLDGQIHDEGGGGGRDGGVGSCGGGGDSGLGAMIVGTNIGGHPNQGQLFAQNTDRNAIINQQRHIAAISAPPPPYHIAILLPENSKELHTEETPPPSYDKLLI